MMNWSFFKPNINCEYKFIEIKIYNLLDKNNVVIFSHTFNLFSVWNKFECYEIRVSNYNAFYKLIQASWVVLFC